MRNSRQAARFLVASLLLPVVTSFSFSPAGSAPAFRPAICSVRSARRQPLILKAQVKDESDAPLKAEGAAPPKMAEPAGASSSNPMSVVKGNYDTMGVFMEKLNAYKNTKDKEQRKVMQREIIELYVEFAVPAVSLALGTLVAFPGAFVLFFSLLSLTGRGLPDVEALFATFPDFIADPAADLLDKVDPALGNAAVAAILVELVSPLLFISQLALKGKIETWLRGKMAGWGLDANGLLKRLERIAGPDEDLF